MYITYNIYHTTCCMYKRPWSIQCSLFLFGRTDLAGPALFRSNVNGLITQTKHVKRRDVMST